MKSCGCQCGEIHQTISRYKESSTYGSQCPVAAKKLKDFGPKNLGFGRVLGQAVAMASFDEVLEHLAEIHDQEVARPLASSWMCWPAGVGHKKKNYQICQAKLQALWNSLHAYVCMRNTNDLGNFTDGNLLSGQKCFTCQEFCCVHPGAHYKGLTWDPKSDASKLQVGTAMLTAGGAIGWRWDLRGGVGWRGPRARIFADSYSVHMLLGHCHTACKTYRTMLSVFKWHEGFCLQDPPGG